VNRKILKTRGCLASLAAIQTAIAVVPARRWRELAKFAEYLLARLKADPRLAGYLAGVEGEDIVASAVLAMQLGKTGKKGRKPRCRDIKDEESFLRYAKSVIRSTCDNYRRHPQAWLRVSSGTVEREIAFWLAESADDWQRLELRDLFAVLVARAQRDVTGKGQLAVLNAYALTGGGDALMPAAFQSKFTRHQVRKVLRHHLRKLTAEDLGIENPTGRELIV
jgi:hypothetical protein